jgi:hypothetical protein
MTIGFEASNTSNVALVETMKPLLEKINSQKK